MSLLIDLFLHNLSMEKNVFLTKESVKIGLAVIYLKIIAGISDTSEALFLCLLPRRRR